MYCNSMPRTGMGNRYTTINGLSDATYNLNNFALQIPTDMAAVLQVANAYMDIGGGNLVGRFSANAPEAPSVYSANGKTYVVTQYPDALPSAARVMLGARQINLRNRKRTTVEFLAVSELVPKTSTDTQEGDTDCPPPENCTEKWIDKTLYVSPNPSKDSIEIPVAFKKLVCEGDTTEDPQLDCDELLRALEESIKQGTVPSVVNGLGELPPDWCKDCEERLVRAFAYVTDYAVAGSRPFKVKVKVLVCETSAEPQVDCEEVIRALGAGMRRRRGVNGLSEATGTSTKKSSEGREFDAEANTLDPNRRTQLAVTQWWWALLLLGGAAVYAARRF